MNRDSHVKHEQDKEYFRWKLSKYSTVIKLKEMDAKDR